MIKRITKQREKRQKRDAEYEALGITKDMREEMGIGDDSDTGSQSSGSESGAPSESSEHSEPSLVMEKPLVKSFRKQKQDNTGRLAERGNVLLSDEDAASYASGSGGDPSSSAPSIKKAKKNTLKHLNIPEFMTRRKSGIRSCVLCDKLLSDGSKQSNVVQQHLKSATHRRRLLYFKTKIMKRLNQTGDTSLAADRADVVRKIVRGLAKEGKATQKDKPKAIISNADKKVAQNPRTLAPSKSEQGEPTTTGRKRRRGRRPKKNRETAMET
ncbi:hypothetical protein FRB95_011871 [Tulasnella sp. JGI-2019a]|nr:hypothetical protein FRB95_011871 [Tulasnella sp. JGI-2019a]